MIFNADNFLEALKNIVVGKSVGVGSGAIPADGGFNQDAPIALGDLTLGSTTVSNTDAAGLRILQTSVSSTNGSTNSFGTFGFTIPRDYDQNTDKLIIRVAAASNGNTDTPTITATTSTLLYAGTMKSDGVTLNTSSTLVAGSTVGGSTVTAITNGVVTTSSTLSNVPAIYEFPMSGLGLIRDTSLVVTLTTGLHNTDKVNLYAIQIVYASCIVGFAEAMNTAGKAVGYDAFRQPIR